MMPGDAEQQHQQTMRLDAALASRGLTESRSKAAVLIKEGKVLLDGIVVQKPSTVVHENSRIVVNSEDIYVSRGAFKLLGAFEAFKDLGLPSAHGLQCLDIGASTGGFCDVLLRNGASRVIALDVGHGQLDNRIARDTRIVEMSGVNIRAVTPEDLPFVPELVVSDVSFISLTYVIPVIRTLVKTGAHIVLLVKPQFEVGKGRLGKRGIVQDQHLRNQAVASVVLCAQQQHFEVVDTIVSPIEGTHGNTEYMLYARAL